MEQLIEWTEARGRSLLDLAVSWHSSHPLVASVIAGATRPEQIHANVAAASWHLSDADRTAVDAIVAPVTS